MVNFTTTKSEFSAIRRIAERAAGSPIAIRYDWTISTIAMDITACHANGCKLKLLDLLQADDFNFWHDIGGITRHLNRETGKLTDCFIPRYAA